MVLGRNEPIKADLVFLDPPYRFLDERPEDLRQLAEHLVKSHLNDEGIVVFRHDTADSLELPLLRRYDHRPYGAMTIELLEPVPRDARA